MLESPSSRIMASFYKRETFQLRSTAKTRPVVEYILSRLIALRPSRLGFAMFCRSSFKRMVTWFTCKSRFSKRHERLVSSGMDHILHHVSQPSCVYSSHAVRIFEFTGRDDSGCCLESASTCHRRFGAVSACRTVESCLRNSVRLRCPSSLSHNADPPTGTATITGHSITV